MENNHKQILVVDDERDIAEIVCELLQGEGYQTCTAHDGRQALEAIRQRIPDAIVLDIKMPVLDGFSVIEQLRADPTLAQIPIVVLTATQVIQDAQERLGELHIRYWIAKPFEPMVLLEAVAEAVRKNP